MNRGPIGTVLAVAWSLAAFPPTVAAQPPVTAAVFTPGGKSVVIGSQAGLEVRSWPGLQTVRKLPTELAHVHDLAFSPRSDLLVTAGGSPGEEGALELYRWPKGERVRRVAVHEDLIYAVAWAPDGRQLATAGADRVCRTLDAETGKVRHTLEGHSGPVLAICFTADGQTLVSAGSDQTLRVWDARTGRLLRSLENHTGQVNALAPRPGQPADALLLVASAGADRTVRLWQPTIGRLVRFARLSSVPLSLAWTADGKQLLAGCADGRLRAFDPDTLEVVREWPGLDGWVHTLAVPPKGDRVLLGGPRGQVRTVEVLR